MKFIGGFIGAILAILGISFYTFVTILNSKGVSELISRIENNKIESDKLHESIRTNDEIISQIDAINLPVGSIIAFGGSLETLKNSKKWHVCDGKELDRKEYNELYESIEINWGSGNSMNTFNIPDLRGQFLRGVDMESNNDPDTRSRSAKYIGGNEGDNVGSFQDDIFKSHGHKSDASRGVISNWAGGAQLGEIMSEPAIFEETGGSETRPKNAYVFWIIKIKYNLLKDYEPYIRSCSINVNVCFRMPESRSQITSFN
ncbi:phage tail protein [Pleomorphovibrio marinus]|uniref:phage tail protein n=1 Tax=Pleomorphovibrio marinus TaxID=2164132 RepID=UPI000E0C6F30|nr:phage tail protein [Pleomorphovibrio marinus]